MDQHKYGIERNADGSVVATCRCGWGSDPIRYPQAQSDAQRAYLRHFPGREIGATLPDGTRTTIRLRRA